MKRLLTAIKRIHRLAFCKHLNKIRVMTLNGRLDYKACKDCGITIFE